jgi:hypothetical protein
MYDSVRSNQNGDDGMLLRVVPIMEAESTSEISVNSYQATLCNIPEDSHLHVRRKPEI